MMQTRLIVLAIATSTHVDSRIPPSSFSRGDLRALERIVLGSAVASPDDVRVLYDPPAIEIREAFESWLPARVHSGDLLVVFISGRGILSSTAAPIILAVDSQCDMLAETAISIDWIVDALRALPLLYLAVCLDLAAVSLSTPERATRVGLYKLGPRVMAHPQLTLRSRRGVGRALLGKILGSGDPWTHELFYSKSAIDVATRASARLSSLPRACAPELLVCSPDGRALLVGTHHQVVRLEADRSTVLLSKSAERRRRGLPAARIEVNGRAVWMGTSAGVARIDLELGTVWEPRLEGPWETVACGGDRVACFTADGALWTCRDSETPRKLADLGAEQTWPLAVSCDGRLVATQVADGAIFVYDTGSETCRTVRDADVRASTLAFSRDSAYLLASGHCMLYEVNSGGTNDEIDEAAAGPREFAHLQMWELSGGGTVCKVFIDGWRDKSQLLGDVDLSPSGRYIVAQDTHYDSFRIVATSTQHQATLQCSYDPLTAAAGPAGPFTFSANGRLLFASFGPALRIYDMARRRLVASGCLLDQGAGWVLLTPDGRWDGDGDSLTWSPPLGEDEVARRRLPGLLRDLLRGIPPRPLAVPRLEPPVRPQERFVGDVAPVPLPVARSLTFRNDGSFANAENLCGMILLPSPVDEYLLESFGVEIRLCSLLDGRWMRAWRLPDDGAANFVVAAAWHPDSRQFVVATADAILYFARVDADGWQRVESLPFSVDCIAWNGRYVGCATVEAELAVFDALSGFRRLALRQESLVPRKGPRQVAFCGPWLAHFRGDRMEIFDMGRLAEGAFYVGEVPSTVRWDLTDLNLTREGTTVKTGSLAWDVSAQVAGLARPDFVDAEMTGDSTRCLLDDVFLDLSAVRPRIRSQVLGNAYEITPVWTDTKIQQWGPESVAAAIDAAGCLIVGDGRAATLWDNGPHGGILCRLDLEPHQCLDINGATRAIAVARGCEIFVYKWNDRVKPLSRLAGHRASIAGIRLRADGRELLSWDRDGVLFVWSVTSGEVRWATKALAATYTADGVAVAHPETGLRLLDANGTRRETLCGIWSDRPVLATGEGGQRLVAEVGLRAPLMWRLPDTVSHVLTPAGAAIQTLTVSTSGKWMAAGNASCLSVYDLERGRVVLRREALSLSLGFLAGDRLLVCVTPYHIVWIRIADGTKIADAHRTGAGSWVVRSGEETPGCFDAHPYRCHPPSTWQPGRMPIEVVGGGVALPTLLGRILAREFSV